MSVSAGVNNCPLNFAYIYGGCYLLIEEPSNWFDGVTGCARLGATIATLTTTAEVGWVYTYLQTQGQTGQSVWIGLNDIDTNGDYLWFDGNKSNFTYWTSGHSSGGNINLNCVLMLYYDYFRWSEAYCSTLNPTLCKWNSSVPSETDGTQCYIYIDSYITFHSIYVLFLLFDI